MGMGIKIGEKVVPFPIDREYEEASKMFADIVVDGYIHLNIDLFDIDHMSSRQISVLVMLHKEVIKLSGSIRLINVTDKLYRVFDILNLDKVISIEKLSDSNPKKQI